MAAQGKDGDDREVRGAVQAALGRAVARREIPDAVIERVVDQVAGWHGQFPISGIDVCPYGICIDHFVRPTQLSKLLTELLKYRPIRKVDLFPWGIITVDLLQVRVEQRFDELAPFVDAGALAHH